jgi:hypothetical protein
MADTENNLSPNVRRALLGVLALIAGIVLCAAFIAIVLLTGLWHPYDR